MQFLKVQNPLLATMDQFNNSKSDSQRIVTYFYTFSPHTQKTSLQKQTVNLQMIRQSIEPTLEKDDVLQPPKENLYNNSKNYQFLSQM